MEIHIKSKKAGNKWRLGGKEITYQENFLFYEKETNTRYYTLSFKYFFKHKNDHVYFAFHKPYTYTKL